MIKIALNTFHFGRCRKRLPAVFFFCLLISFMCCSLSLKAGQGNNKMPFIEKDTVITGKITDETGIPLSGVSVVVNGTMTGTVSDSMGNYSLRLNNTRAGITLTFSAIGFAEQAIAVNNQRVINVQLKHADAKSLDEVVVIGYGTQKKISLTGAVNQIDEKDIAGKPVVNLLQALQGEAPNLIIQQTSQDPGSSANLNIRGLGTLGDNTPLVVIDGIAGGDINQINPNDVASVSILKDAGSAAIYGSRSANGVILITTKSGRLNQKPHVVYDGSYGIQHSDVLLKKVDAWQNAYYKNLALVNAGLPPSYTPDQIAALKARGNGTYDVQHILKNAPLQSHNVSISGGGVNNTYFLSAGYQDQASNLIGNGGSGPDFGYKKYNLRLNQSSTIGRLKVNVILSYNKNQNKSNSVGDNNIFADADRVPYDYNWQDSAGNYLTNPIASQYNEMGVLEKGGYFLSDNDQIFGNLNGTLSITKDLKLTGIFGGTVIDNEAYFRRMQVNDVPSGVYGDDRTVYDNNYKSLLTNTQLYAEYDKNIKGHSFKVLLGASNESYQQKGFQLQQLYTDIQLGTPTTGTVIDATNSFNSNASTTETSLNSLFGRLSYSYNNKYFLEGTFRDDGSSKFASGKRWGFFPSIAGSWVATEEPFMQNVKKTLNTLKLRLSYGVLGNQNVNAYQYQTSYFNYNNAYGFNNVAVGGAGYSLGNPDLTWERAATFNAGTDLAFLNNKLNISFDYFNKVTSDILYTRQDVPALFGAGFPDYNVAKVRNLGWETTISYRLETNAVTQDFSFNLADNKNTLLALTSGATQQIINLGEYSLLRKVGEPITQYYGYKVAGIFQTQAEVNNSAKPAGLTLAPGDLKFVDQNKDGVIDDKDQVPLGNPFPRFTFGFNYSIAYKGFDMSLFIQGVGKRSEMIRGETMEPFHYNYSATMFENQTDFWTPENPNAKYPRLSSIGTDANTNDWRDGSDIYLFNAGYVRLKNINIGYTFSNALTKKAGIQRLRISVIGQNLLTLSKLNFLDPETSEFNNDLSLNAASNSGRLYPLAKFYGVGLDITF